MDYLLFSPSDPDPKPVTGFGFTPDGTIPAGAIACTTAQAAAWQGSTIVGGAIVPPPVVPPTLAEEALKTLADGLMITSTVTPALDGTYAADPSTVAYVNSEVTSILLNNTFADGTATIEWPDALGTLHPMTIVQFKALAAALGVFVSGIRKCVIGAAGAALPETSVTLTV